MKGCIVKYYGNFEERLGIHIARGGSGGGGGGGSSYSKGLGLGLGQTNVLENMLKANNRVPYDETVVGRIHSFARKGSNERTRSRSEADYPYRGGLYTGTSQDRDRGNKHDR